MRIGIDARLISQTGIGRYIRNILSGIARGGADHEFVVYIQSDSDAVFVPQDSRFVLKQFRSHWHTIEEQVVGPYVFSRSRLDLLHVPYITIPLFYAGKTVVTIHDLTLLTEKTGKASTLPAPVYTLKHLAFQQILRRGLERASGVITVSHWTADELLRTYPFLHGKTTTIYEGVDSRLMRGAKVASFDARIVPSPYFLYVGNAYPHKNLDMMIQAFIRFQKKHTERHDTLVLVGPDDHFYEGLQKRYAALIGTGALTIYHTVSDEILGSLYRHAIALVFPSIAEGFGLPALESVALGTRVLVSDIPVFHEILGDVGTFITPTDMDAWVHAMTAALSTDPIPRKQSMDAVTRFSWEKAAAETVKFYETSALL